jgi:hypothetical protein
MLQALIACDERGFARDRPVTLAGVGQIGAAVIVGAGAA